MIQIPTSALPPSFNLSVLKSQLTCAITLYVHKKFKMQCQHRHVNHVANRKASSQHQGRINLSHGQDWQLHHFTHTHDHTRFLAAVRGNNLCSELVIPLGNPMRSLSKLAKLVFCKRTSIAEKCGHISASRESMTISWLRMDIFNSRKWLNVT